MPVVPSKLKDYQLIKYFKTLESMDVDSLDLAHYGLVKNEMIKRDLLQGKIENLNDYLITSPMTNCNKVEGGSHVPKTFIVADELGYDVPFKFNQELFV